MDRPLPFSSWPPFSANSTNIVATETIDITDHAVVAERPSFQVNDRVQRLNGTCARSDWGTITGQVDEVERDVWLVIDNDGITHRDRTIDLAPARRRRIKRQRPGEVNTIPPGSTGGRS